MYRSSRDNNTTALVFALCIFGHALPSYPLCTGSFYTSSDFYLITAIFIVRDGYYTNYTEVEDQRMRMGGKNSLL